MRNPVNAANDHSSMAKPDNDNGCEADVTVILGLRDLAGLLADVYVATLKAEANDNRAVASGGSVR